MAKEYAFDVKLFAVARVKASSQREAEDKLAAYMDCYDLGDAPDDHVLLSEASADGDPDLIEIDGEAV